MSEGRWDVPSSWVWAEAREFSTIVGGGTPKNAKQADNYAEEGIPWLTPADLSGYRGTHISRGARDLSKKGFESCSAKVLPAGSVLLSSRAPVGYCVIASNEICTNQGFKSFVLASDDISPNYLRYYLIGSKQYLESEASGTTFLELSGGRAEQLQVPIAPTSEQRRIVSKIDELFSRIEEGERALERVSRLVERYRQSVLKAAVTGELTRDWREKHKHTLESGEALLARILTARREAWEQTELARMQAKGITPRDEKWKQNYESPGFAETERLAELPNAWTWATAEQVCETVHSGTTPERPLLQATSSDGVPFIKVYNLTFDGSLDFSIDPTYVGAAHHRKRMSRSRTLPGDVLTNIVGPPLGKVSVVPSTYPEWNINQAVVGFRPVSGLLNSFLSIYLQSESAKAWLRSTVKTTTSQMNLAVTTCRRLPVPVPSLAEQQCICTEVERALSYADAIFATAQEALARSNGLRQATLKSAFSGLLVEQDETNESAAILLERIAAERADANITARKRGRKPKNPA